MKKHILNLLFIMLLVSLSSCSGLPFFCDHIYNEPLITKQPTCTNYGESKKICSKCGWTIKEEIEPLGHDLIHHDKVEATCLTSGNEAYDTCGRCDYTTYKEIKATGHIFSNEWTYDETYHYHKATCGHDEVSNKETHLFEEIVTKEATHSEDGELTFSCKCGYSYTSKIDRLVEHVYNKEVVDNRYLKQEATCHSLALYYKSCICGEASTTETFDAGDYKAHSFTNYINDENGKCGEAATKTAKCDNCDATNTIEIEGSKVEHDNEVIYKSTELNKSIYQCKKCGNKYLEVDDKKMDYSQLGISSSMYDSFEDKTNKKDLQAYYNECLLHLIDFLYDFDSNLTSDNECFYKANYKDFNLSTNEALSVWNSLESDVPICYYIPNAISYDSSTINFSVEKEYYKASDRQTYFNNITNGINTFEAALKSNVKSKEEIATIKYTYEYLIDKTNYAYDEHGVPSTKLIAHSILGFFSNQNVVCEGYSKAFQLLLNRQGIKNLYVTGVADNGDYLGEHAWNYVSVNDNWYLVDVTWDDTDKGPAYNHFLLTKEEALKESRTIKDDNLENGISYHYDVPELSNNPVQVKVSLYKQDEFIASAFIDDALSLINDSNSNYIIYLYDYANNKSYLNDYYLSVTNLPIAKSISFIGLKDNEIRLHLPTIINANSDLEFTNISFVNDVDGNVNLGNNVMNLTNVKGNINHKIVGNKIVIKDITSLYLNDHLYFNKPVEANEIIVNNAYTYFVNSSSIDNLTISSGSVTIHNLYYKDGNEMKVEIGKLSLLSTSGESILNITDYYDQNSMINVNINEINSANVNNSIRMACSNFDYLPVIKIKGKISNPFIFSFSGQSKYLKDSITGVYFDEYKDPKTYSKAFINIGSNSLNDLYFFVSTSKTSLEQIDNSDLKKDLSGNVSFK